LILSSTVVSKSIAYAVTIGGGGAAVLGGNPPSGSSSFFGALEAAGGLGGTVYQGPSFCGSAGGVYGTSTTQPILAAIVWPNSLQFNSADDYFQSFASMGGVASIASQGPGGGGAGSVGSGSTTAGSGRISTITGSSVTYAEGGVGRSSTAGVSAGVNGGANTGTGGGGASSTAANTGGLTYLGGNGGSGVVIIAYKDTYSAPASITGTYNEPTRTGYRVYRFTGSGSITF
jgi:hypothetical protein